MYPTRLSLCVIVLFVISVGVRSQNMDGLNVVDGDGSTNDYRPRRRPNALTRWLNYRARPLPRPDDLTRRTDYVYRFYGENNTQATDILNIMQFIAESDRFGFGFSREWRTTDRDRPLTREKRQQIQKNIRHLSELIDVDTGLLVLLYSMGAISAIEQQELNSERVKQLKAMKLLQVILQKSDRTLKCFVDALRETNQAHVVATLEKGNIISLHAEFRSASDLLDQFEEDLINILEPLAQQVSFLDCEVDPAEDVQPIIHELQEICHKRIKILGLKKGKSISIYFWCQDVKAMAELFLMFETRQLEHILEKIFNLVKTSVKISNAMVRVTLAVDDLQVLKEAFQLNELAQNKPQITERDSFLEARVLEREQMKKHSSQKKTDAGAESDVAVELHMKKVAHSPEKTESEGAIFELQRNVEMVASENIILKEKLEATEQERSNLEQQLQLMRNENTVLIRQLEKAKSERDQIQERYDEVLREKIEQQCEQFGSMLLPCNIFALSYRSESFMYLAGNGGRTKNLQMAVGSG